MFTKKYEFHKLCGTGNDFVMIDHRKPFIKDLKTFAERACHRHRGIGADGVIYIETSETADITMRIFNADGSEAEMCGNGMRCTAWLAHHRLRFPSRLKVSTLAGVIGADVQGDAVTVALSAPTDFRDYAPLEVDDGIFYFYFINTGVPHCVIFEDDLASIDVERLGREIRHHTHFEPAGTNVNFVHVKDTRTIAVRTYERGVEHETLACGTGSTAAAIISVLVKQCQTPVTVQTKSGEELIIDFKHSLYTVTDVTLCGPVTYAFRGIIPDTMMV